MNKSRLIFVTGGGRSGKSDYALTLSESIPGKRCYLATAQPLDDEMSIRIQRHKAERDDSWGLIEEALNIKEMIEMSALSYDLILIDCITIWISNMMYSLSDRNAGAQEAAVIAETQALIDVCRSSLKTFVIVSNEVGLGIVPENPLARLFRDIAGRANQLIAKASDEAYLISCGIPLRLK